MPNDLVPRQISKFDKAAHFTMYAVLAGLLAQHLSEVLVRWRAVVLAIVVAATFGAIDEWHQQYIAGRSTELADWYADSLGAAAGALLFAFYSRWRSRTLTT